MSKQPRCGHAVPGELCLTGKCPQTPQPPSRGLLYRGALSTKTSARLASAIMKEFGPVDGGVVLDWLISRIQYADGLYERALAVADGVNQKMKKGER